MEIYIDIDRNRGTKKVFIFDRQGAIDICYYYDDGQLKTVEKDRNQSVFESWAKPFIELPIHFADELIQSFVNHANENGIKSKDGSFKDGKIKAMEVHMDLMTDIVRKQLKLDQ